MKAFEAEANTFAGVKYKKGIYLDHLDLLFIQIIQILEKDFEFLVKGSVDNITRIIKILIC